MNTKQRKEIKKYIEQINKLELAGLQIFAQKWHLAKPDLDAVVFQWVLKAIDLSFEYLNENSNFSAMIEMSELISGDMGDLS